MSDGNLAVSVTLIREARSGAGLEVFWAKRRRDRAFLGGFWAYVAGKVEESDGDLRTSAYRECLEECGFWPGEEGAVEVVAEGERATRWKAAGGEVSEVWKARLHEFGWWETPSWMAAEFVTLFYGLYLEAEEGERLDGLGSELDGEEFEEGGWIGVEEALERWREGAALSTTPIVEILRGLKQQEDWKGRRPEPFGAVREEAWSEVPNEVVGGWVVYPVRSNTLSPATHTNALVVGGRRFVVVDPGAPAGPEREALEVYVGARMGRGDTCVGVLVSHHHVDHMEGLASLEGRFSLRVLMTERTAGLMGREIGSFEAVEEGTVLDVLFEGAGDGGGDEAKKRGGVRVVEIPGHASGMVGVWEEETGMFFGADLVATEGTIVVAPPDGDMGAYLGSLRRVRDLGPRVLVPSHGEVIVEPEKHLEGYIAHRLKREEKVVEALKGRPGATAKELVPFAYPEVVQAVYPLAAMSLLAHLEHLVDTGRATKEDERFTLGGSVSEVR